MLGKVGNQDSAERISQKGQFDRFLGIVGVVSKTAAWKYWRMNPGVFLGSCKLPSSPVVGARVGLGQAERCYSAQLVEESGETYLGADYSNVGYFVSPGAKLGSRVGICDAGFGSHVRGVTQSAPGVVPGQAPLDDPAGPEVMEVGHAPLVELGQRPILEE